MAFLGTAQSNVDRPARWGRQLRRLLDLVSGRVDCIRVFDIDETVTGFRPHHDRYAPTYNRITHAMVSQYPTPSGSTTRRAATWPGPSTSAGTTSTTTPLDGERWAGSCARWRPAATRPSPAGRSGTSPTTTGPPRRSPGGAARPRRRLPQRHYRAEVGTFVLAITRGQFLSMLWRLQGEPDGFGPHPWSDGTARLDGALRWAAATGVGVGFADGRYRPGAPSTRGQALAMLWRLAGRPDGFGPHPWSDGTARLDGALRWAAATGVMGGYRNRTFRPDPRSAGPGGAGAVPVRRALKLRVLARLPHSAIEHQRRDRFRDWS